MAKTKRRTKANSVPTKGQVDAIVGSIGPKVKMLRQEQRLSLQQLAVKAEVSAAAIHKIERNDMVPTITTLLKVAAALDRPVAFFVEEDGAPPDSVVFTPASQRPTQAARHEGLTLAGVSGPRALFRTTAAFATVSPGATSGEKPLVHAGEELVVMLEGTLVFDFAGTQHELGVGDSLHFLGDQPHHWHNPGDVDAHALWIALRDG
ncbi:MAG TPA: cupin domain-containing protein [Nocardioides sp.]|uniref:helix-turn-helix domain-containing protein n=1 Tax=Nocardioides sp. TaxID=35761 RepID=UPI002E34769C|nr:cupin domain-containing protein [Nocardioides sp.]HEX5087770.1 cupin domain-containing protein [Nocardioides sp.]